MLELKTVFAYGCDATYITDGKLLPEFEWVVDPIGGEGGYIERIAGFPLFPWVAKGLRLCHINEFEYESMNHQLLRG